MSHAGKSLNTRVRTGGVRASTRPCLLALVFLFTLPMGARPQTTPTSALNHVEPFKISVSVSSVVLHATVQNHNGTPVSGLGKNDFQVFEDGVLQPIEYYSHADIPVTVGLVLDNSGSMQPKRDEVIAAALAFARSSNPQDQMFVVNFNEYVSLGLPANMPFTDQTAQLQMALARFDANGETALYDALAVALLHVKLGNRDKKVLIVVSDGGDNASKYKLGQILTMAEKSDAIIYAIGIYTAEDPDKNIGALRQLAKATGGEAFFPETLPEVTPVCERIAHNIREQYTLAYSPANSKQDGAYRVIQVKASAPGHRRLSVLTRAGYFAPVQPQPAAPISGSQSIRP